MKRRFHPHTATRWAIARDQAQSAAEKRRDAAFHYWLERLAEPAARRAGK